RAGGQSEHGHQYEPHAGVDHQLRANAAALQTDGDAQRLQGGEHGGEVASPHGDLLAAQLAFLLQLGQRLVHHGEQLQDDGGSDVGHDAQRENGEAPDVAAVEDIEQAEEAAAALVEELLQRGGVDAGRGNVAAQAIDGQHGEREQHSLAQVRDRKSVV